MDDRYFVVGDEDWFNANDSQNYLLYGEVYKMTVNTLIEHFGKSSDELMKKMDETGDPEPAALPGHAFGIIPLIYNFRHYIELKLKGLILMKNGEMEKTHDISNLLKKLQSIAPSERISKETEEIIIAIQKLDTRQADAFRYPYDKNDKLHFQMYREFLKNINSFDKFKMIVSTVIGDLTNVEGDFEAEIDNLRYADEYQGQ